MNTLTPEQAQTFYDRFGKKQDNQGFYESSALHELVAHSALQDARAIFEFGCGTGRFALELLQDHLHEDANYAGIDISTTMVALATERLSAMGERASVSRAGFDPIFPLESHSVDRVISTYVLDLLPESTLHDVLAEARRTLRPDGLLCLTGITPGITPLSRVVMTIWRWLFTIRPSTVGGCRPLRLTDYLTADGWEIRFHNVVVAWGIASEVVVASKG